jgi:hypothetical protein
MASKEPESVGSDRVELKKLIKLSMDKPVSMAFATDANGKAVIQMHKIKPPRTLERDLKSGIEGGKNHRFGQVMVDPEFPKQVKFVVNKACGGMARKLVIALKGTGFKKIQIVTEAGEALEEAENEEDEEEDEEEERSRPAVRQPDDEPATSRTAPDADDERPNFYNEDDDEPAPEEEEDDRTRQADSDDRGQDAADREDDRGGQDQSEQLEELRKELKDYVSRIPQVLKVNPSMKSVLIALATDVSAALKNGDLDQAEAAFSLLTDAIDNPSDGSADASAPGRGDAAQEEPTPGRGDKQGAQGDKQGAKQSVQTFHKSRIAWTATRAKVDKELQKLSKAILDASEGEDLADGLEAQFFQVVDPVLAELDETLSETLQAAADADGDERQKLLEEARKTIARYTKFVQSNSIISDLDNNPFVPLAIGKTLTSTLATLTNIMK